MLQVDKASSEPDTVQKRSISAKISGEFHTWQDAVSRAKTSTWPLCHGNNPKHDFHMTFLCLIFCVALVD